MRVHIATKIQKAVRCGLPLAAALAVAACTGTTEETVELPASDSGPPTLTLCVNVDDPGTDICDGISVNAGGQDVTLEGPDHGEIIVIASATDEQSGVQEVRLLTQTHTTTCATDDPDLVTQTTGTFVPITYTDNGTYSTGDAVPLGRTKTHTYTLACDGDNALGYTLSFHAEATNYLGQTVGSQLITVRPPS